MKIHITDNKEKATGELTFTSKGKKGHIILPSVDKVIINTKTNEITITDFNLPMKVLVDEIICLNLNWVFMNFYELNIEYEEDNLLLSASLREKKDNL